LPQEGGYVPQLPSFGKQATFETVWVSSADYRPVASWCDALEVAFVGTRQRDAQCCPIARSNFGVG